MKTKGQNYIEKCTQHTFLITKNKENFYYKIINVNSKVIQIIFNEHNCYVQMLDENVFDNYSSKNKNYVSCCYKSLLFNNNYYRDLGYIESRKTIKTSKHIKELINCVKQAINDSELITKELIIDIVLNKDKKLTFLDKLYNFFKKVN